MSFSPGGVDWAAQQQAMWTWVVAGSGLAAGQVVWGQQYAPRPAGPAIVMRISNIAEIGQPWAKEEANPLTFADITVSTVDATANTLTATAHGRSTGDGPVHLASTGTLPTATGGDIAASTDYWLIAPDANTLQLARTYADTGGGQGAGNPTTPIDLTSTGSGTITISDTPDTVAAGSELLSKARGYVRVTLELVAHTTAGVGLNMAVALLQNIRGRRRWPTQISTFQNANIGVIGIDRIRAVQGVKDALLFEPRASMDVHLCVVSEEGEALTIITRADVLDTTTNQTFTAGS